MKLIETTELAQCQLKVLMKPQNLVYFSAKKTTLLTWAYGCYGNFSLNFFGTNESGCLDDSEKPYMSDI